MQIKKIRIYEDITQEEMAKRLGVSRSVYSMWEEESEIIPLNKLINLCDTFNFTLDYTLGLSETKTYENEKKDMDIDLMAKRLKLIRRLNNATQNDVAKKLYIARSSISKYEHGITPPITSYLIGFCKLFNISADYITGKIDEELKI